ncbi:MAG: fdrA domain protein [Nitrospinaceae bacterium]|jgi:hypothetical protein|nr:fdrA domain protein [Nitrospinaceae bacterium]MBT3435339.1 fdrA domain protein [Nitrospinaceae bacterium]MBT3820580.1 fdrA domain protein [Nitrospinaceae bacterium]MBT4093462.1 fdrA domain protein [Nitrospinaceae bacterium]MBT4429263.1 fdrA domain protein [Nitrospinaceae bacterium]
MIKKLLGEQPKIINIGLDGFFRDLKNRSVPVVHLDWSPPASGDSRLANLLSKLKSI